MRTQTGNAEFISTLTEPRPARAAAALALTSAGPSSLLCGALHCASAQSVLYLWKQLPRLLSGSQGRMEFAFTLTNVLRQLLPGGQAVI